MRRTAASMSPEEERKHGLIAYGLVAGMIAMLAIVYSLTWTWGAPNLFIFALGIGGGTGIGLAVYRRTWRCPVCQSVDCDSTCPVCGCDRDDAHARFHGKTALCTCNATKPEAGDGPRAANDDRASGALSGSGVSAD